MTEPPLKICGVCRGSGCDLCDFSGVGYSLDWLMQHGDEWEIVGEPGLNRSARQRSEHEIARLRRNRGV